MHSISPGLFIRGLSKCVREAFEYRHVLSCNSRQRGRIGKDLSVGHYAPHRLTDFPTEAATRLAKYTDSLIHSFQQIVSASYPVLGIYLWFLPFLRRRVINLVVGAVWIQHQAGYSFDFISSKQF